uniref:CD302 molecule n=1 Tax=Oreochromis niloticus TaxID=8128 RepID=A0A669BJX8_ORENI
VKSQGGSPLFLSGCPADGRTWLPFKDRCYHFVHGDEDKIKSYSFEDAKTHCKGFELLTIQSGEENKFVIDYSSEVWKNSPPVIVWLGMYYDSNSKCPENLLDGSLMSDLAAMDKCAALHTNTGKWEIVSCSDDLENGVICEAAQEKAKRSKSTFDAVLSALVILSVVAIVGVSAVVWFLHQKHNFGSGIVTAFEYHPPFRVPDTDQSCLVEAEETDSTP